MSMGCQDGKPLGDQPQPLLTPLFRIFAPPWAAPIKREHIFIWGLQAPALGQLVPDPALPSLLEELSKELAKIN